MKWNQHREQEGQHSILSASKSPWLRYSDERLFEYVENLGAARRGTMQHTYAQMAIKLRNKQPNSTKTLNMYVNDAIGFFMKPEQILYYSPWAFGTADAIGYRDSEKVLRIFDLKTGKTKVSDEQLLVYAAYFCLEYNVKPLDIEYDLRIYQNDEIYVVDVDPLDVLFIMERIKELSKLITDRMNEEV